FFYKLHLWFLFHIVLLDTFVCLCRVFVGSKRFRFDRATIFEIVGALTPQLQHVTERNGALSPSQQVLIALRFFASGSFQNSLGDMVNVHRTTACRAIRRVSLALMRIMGRYVRLPTQEEAARMKQDFYFKSGLPGIIGCIDGTHVRIQAPSQDEYLFVNRKGYHSINVQLVCTNDMQIIDLVSKWPGSTHDARILRESALHREFEEGRITGLLLGDSGYPLKRWLMTPVILIVLGLFQFACFYCSFRFHCLHSEMRMHPERVCVVIAACVVLHNICVEKRMPLPRQVDVLDQPEEVENPVALNQEDIRETFFFSDNMVSSTFSSSLISNLIFSFSRSNFSFSVTNLAVSASTLTISFSRRTLWSSS
uniref:Putative nuclease HARBI1 n=1 Tax=Neogobius melanostomus TaxID=47308 RepID=A0A8C6WF12_9GOBI